ncbi:Engulfment and cell motility protein 1 [Orchesella cincta]|uniref:Engulfment and cell motility protein 1 n=1 Tax=Orchesella cincta TaxID=48709 RepID=A0A1D2MCI4_ORCCI|nr:Engulfment and cell motility protein 1 [Orchesella cincta]
MALLHLVCSYVNSPKGMDKAAIGPALQVLESAVSSGAAYSQVEKEVTLGVLVTHVQNPDPQVQQNALALVNALFSKADPFKRKTLSTTLASRKYRDIVLQYVINKKPGDRPSETNHELYVMQTLFLNLLEERRQTPVDPQDQDAQTKLKELLRIAFESDVGNYSAINFETNNLSNGGRKDKSNHKRDYHKLGFTNDSNPALDFAAAPPGALALDCMYHLATSHTECYSKIVLESACRTSGDECPFAKSSIALVNSLCDILKMGEPPGDQQGKFYPFYFHHDKPFEELYCICAQLVTKTWKEMRATMEDFDKVFDVVREQIRRALDKIPDTFDSLRSHLNALTYQEINNLRQQERTSREEWELQARPIQELRKKLEPEMIELIKQNRLNYLIAGTRFNKFSSQRLMLQKVKGKFWFCRLSNNTKVFHYGECEEKATPLPEELSSKLNVLDIKDLLTGRDCPHMKDSKGKKSNVPLAFSLVTEKETPCTVDFVAPDEKTFDLWTDGINALLGKDMISKEAKKDLDVLLHMEIKLRLLDIEGIPEIPQDAPPIPALPQNFDFSTLQLNGIATK